MLDPKAIIKNQKKFIEKLKLKGIESSITKKIIIKIENIMNFSKQAQEMQAKKNALSREIGLKKSKNQDVTNTLNELAKIKEKINSLTDKDSTKSLDSYSKIKEILSTIPNIPNDNTPIGKNEKDNVIIKKHSKLGKGEIKNVIPHYEIGVKLGIVDFERSTKLAGARFWGYIGDGAKLVRALENFMLDTHIKNGYTEMSLPIMLKSDALYGTGQLPKFSSDLFKIENRDSYLIPTAEVSLTNFYSNEILNLDKPICLTAYSPCFRSEAGSGGKDMKGLIRAHQFNKVELVKIVKQQDAASEYKKTLLNAKKILELLELPYREMQLCSGDLSFTAEETIDLEVWLPSENRYREISSVSLFGTFQARRAMIRYREDNTNKIACTINGSGLAIDRTIASILENYQEKDGTIKLPKVLIPYMNNMTHIKSSK